MKFKIFIGPLKGFKKYIPTESLNSLTSVVRVMDIYFKDPSIVPNIDWFKHLIIYSNEYTSVNEHFIEGFVNYIWLYKEQLAFEQVYLHNPPKNILEQLHKHKECEVETQQFPYEKMTTSKLKLIKDNFNQVVFGQPHVKSEILGSLYSLSNRHQNNPKVLMLYGPSGVGKTETAKLINHLLTGSKLFRKQLSMFHSDNVYSYIFGDKVFSLSKDLIERETNVLLLDEFDKAHPLFYSAFYEMFDEGVFEDKYYKVKLQNSIILCTSNFESEKEIKERLGPALFSRFDNIIPYNRLSMEAKIKILERTYEEEKLNFKEEDIGYIEDYNVLDSMKKVLDKLENARDIRKTLNKVMAYPLVQKL